MTSWASPFPFARTADSPPPTTGATGGDGSVAAAVRGDEEEFGRLYRAHVGRIYALALRLAHDPTDADQLTQDVFVRAWERLVTFRGESSFGTWLHRLAVNVVLSDRRSAWRRARRIDEGEGVIDAVPDPKATGPHLGMDLDRAVAGLPPGARTVFVLHDVEGYEHQEIAAMTGIAVGTSKAQLFRARRLLREALER